jgi:hypothetical protein
MVVSVICYLRDCLLKFPALVCWVGCLRRGVWLTFVYGLFVIRDRFVMCSSRWRS